MALSMIRDRAKIGVEGDWRSAEMYRGPLEYTYPDSNGDGIANNGKPIYTTAQAAAQLARSGAVWDVSDGKITYTFLNKPSGQYNSSSGKLDEFFASSPKDYVAGFSPFTAAQRAAARDSMGMWDDLIAPKFVEVTGKGAADISLMNTNTGPAQASAYQPFYSGDHGRFQKIQGDVYINSAQPDNFDLYYGGYGQTTMTHEIGHAIGLSHPGDYNFAVGRSIDYAKDAVYFQDSKQFSIMSYFDSGKTGAKGYVNWATGGFFQNPQTPMVHDIAAVQSIYGADPTTRTGNTTYGFNVTADLADRPVFDFTKNINPFLTIYDAGGHDTLDMSGWSRNFVLDLREGNFSTGWGQEVNAAQLTALYGIPFSQAQWDALFEGRLGSNPGFLTDNIGIAFGTVIEDGITGAGNDRLIGNDAANRLNGGAGNDTYTGGGGADTFVVKNAGNTDTLTDFKSGLDKVDLSSFGIHASDITISGKTIFADINGDKVADLAIVSQGDAITLTDIIFG